MAKVQNLGEIREKYYQLLCFDLKCAFAGTNMKSEHSYTCN